MPWEDDARCLRHDPELFFESSARAERRAKSICNGCPVKLECLAYALESRIQYGIWGGMNVTERRSLLRRSAGAPDGRRQLAAATA